MPSNFLAHVRKVLRWCAGALLFVGMFAVLLALEKIPGSALRSVNGSFDLNRVALLTASAVVGLLGIGFLFLSMRGFDKMAVAEDGIVLPIRSIRDMLLGIRKVLPFEQIAGARVASNSQGKLMVEYRIRSKRGRDKIIAYSVDWADDAMEFQRLLSEHVTSRQV